MGRRQRYFFVYILSNYKRNVLYTGVTSNLLRRVNVLIAKQNPTLKDLYPTLV